jgi:hypothetical protein
VVAVVAAYGVWVGRRAAARAVADPRALRGAPRPWAPVLFVVAMVVLLVGASQAAAVVGYVAAAVGVLALMASTSWLAFVASGRVTRRTEKAAVLLAARRIRADHGAAGRAAAAVGAIGLTLGCVGTFVAAVGSSYDGGDVAFYVVPAVLVAVLALLAAALVALSLTLHTIEATLERRREMSALVATGVPVRVLEAANRAECRLVTLPLTLGASVLGAVVSAIVLRDGFVYVYGGLLATLVAVGAVLLAGYLAARVTRPWLLAAVSADNLRTE